jgi:hypothetical protein
LVVQTMERRLFVDLTNVSNIFFQSHRIGVTTR